MANKIKDIYDTIISLGEKFESLNQKLNVLEAKINELDEKANDSMIRSHDTQDRAYDLLYKIDKFENKIDKLEKNIIKIGENTLDAKIRTHDTQNRAYDIIYKNDAKARQRDLMFWSIYKQKNESLENAKLRFFKSLPKSEGDLKLKQDAVGILINKFSQICEENKIKYWLDFGTMLGAYRHNGFVPWDDDADVGMLREDLNKFIEVVGNYKGFRLNDYYSIPDVNILHIFRFGFDDDIQLFLDIFVYDYTTREDNDNDVWSDYLDIRKDYNDDARKYAPTKEEVLDESDNVAKHRILNKTKLKKIINLENKYIKKFDKHLGTTNKKTKKIIWSVENFRMRRVRILDTSLIFPLKKYKFNGHTYYGVNNALDYLNFYYDDIFSLPNDIYAHEHIKLGEEERKKLIVMTKKYK